MRVNNCAVAVCSALLFASFGAMRAQAGALHVFCVSPTPACVDTGSSTPTTALSPDFGFTSSPDSGTTTFYLDVLIPDNATNAATETFTLTGTNTGNATVSSKLFSSTVWGTGKLEGYLGNSATPANPIGNFLPQTQEFDPLATGYDVYQFDFGSVTFGSKTDPTFSTSFDFPEGSFILAYADTQTCTTKHGSTTCSDTWKATANSSALLIDSPVPEPSSAAALIAGLFGLAAIYRRRQA